MFGDMNPRLASRGSDDSDYSLLVRSDSVVSGVTPVEVDTIILPSGFYAFDFFISSNPSNNTGRFVNLLSFDKTTGILAIQGTYGNVTSGANFYQYIGRAAIGPLNTYMGSPGAANAGLNITFGAGSLVLTEATRITLSFRQAVASGTLTTYAGSYSRFRKIG